MKSVLLVVLLAAAATAAVVSNEVPDVVVLPDVTDGDEMGDIDMNEMPEVFVTDVDELIDAADLTDVAEQTGIVFRRSLSSGSIGSSNVRLYNAGHRSNGVAGRITTRDITVSTIRPRRLTAIWVTRIGATQNATPSIVSGGVGNSFVVIRIRSAVGRGFNYSVQVWGKDCAQESCRAHSV